MSGVEPLGNPTRREVELALDLDPTREVRELVG